MEKKKKTEKKRRVVKEAGEAQEAGEEAKEEGARECGVVRASTPAGGRGEAASEGRWMRYRPQMCLGTCMYQVWTRMGMGMGIGMGLTSAGTAGTRVSALYPGGRSGGMQEAMRMWTRG
jgi:hypothetical protein